jgi:hypothetical protein
MDIEELHKIHAIDWNKVLSHGCIINDTKVIDLATRHETWNMFNVACIYGNMYAINALMPLAFREYQLGLNMYFAEFYHRTQSGQFTEACGDRSVLILDGRESATSHHTHAIQWGKKHNFAAYKLCTGESFTRANTRTGLHMVTAGGAA